MSSTITMYAQRFAYYIIVLLLLKITHSHISAKQNHLMSEQWALEDMPFLSIIFATSEYLPAGPCKEDTRRFLHDLLNGSLWATQMFDSSTKYPDGIFYGHTRHVGNFDECYNMQVNVIEEGADVHEINGKYCRINITYKKMQTISVQKKSSKSQYISNSLDMRNSFWKLLEVEEDPLYGF
ncbi:uncharacterized protein LOC112588454 [Harpegnathos saltator]|uniref:uncharacterized protein LOC112588454 n=1 Tax=Harpegnathos saltator TaxID=610380 RepID=UPI000DBED10D|nr:uncharacterized protein LOC112588454 [Harpegnathos saltator]